MRAVVLAVGQLEHNSVPAETELSADQRWRADTLQSL